MDTIQENVEDLVGHLTDYVDMQKELLVIVAQEKAASVLSQTLFWAIVGALAAFAAFFFGIALAFWAGTHMGSTEKGFLLVGGFYTLAAVLCLAFWKYLFEDRLKTLFLNKFMSQNGANNG